MNESLTTATDTGLIRLPRATWLRSDFATRKCWFCAFVGVMLGVGISSLFLPSKYKAETKLLVKRERIDPVITPEQNAPLTFHDTVGEEEINSELELMTSTDVLRKVVVGPAISTRSISCPAFCIRGRRRKTARIKRLPISVPTSVEVLKKTNVISVTYESNDPWTAQRVLADAGRCLPAKTS